MQQQRQMPTSARVETARKHICILRHSMACRQMTLEGNPQPCAYPVCAQMRQVLDHVLMCNRGPDCDFQFCVTCKQLQAHVNSCTDRNCEVCYDAGQPYTLLPNNQHGQTVNYASHPNSQVPLMNGTHAPVYPSNHDAELVTMQPQQQIRNGCDWRTSYNMDRRDQLVQYHAGKFFPPETYSDARAGTVFQLFKEQEAKLFTKCSTEKDYQDRLASFSDSLRSTIKNQMRSNPSNFTNGTAPVRTFKPEPAPLTDQPRSAADIVGPKIEAPQTNMHSEPNDIKKPEPSPPIKKESICEVKKGEVKPEPTSTGTVENSRRCVWPSGELRNAFLPLVDTMSQQSPYVEPFLLPVAYKELGLTDYLQVVPHPMDISTIAEKLKEGEYADPWDVVDDFWLMFNNAWKYNKKNSKVYKSCSKLAEIFETLVDPLMQKLGFCCGHEFVHYPHVLACATEKSCNINRDAVYYVYENSDENKKKSHWDKYVVCERCYQEAGEKVAIDDPNAPVYLEKSLFEKQRNNIIVREEFVNCRECGRKWHKVCACHMDEIWPSGFVCKTCITKYGITRSLNRYTAKRLPKCKLSDFLEKRVNDFMKKNESNANEVTIRVLASANKSVEVKKYMRKHYSECGKFPESFPYRVKVMFAFQELDGQEVCFFGLHVQEYSSDCPAPNSRRVYIAYLDSVYFFQPKQYRTDIYHEILVGYLLYAKRQGFATAHIWACPPGEGDDYIFHMHPADQKIPKPKRLQEWYQKMLKRAHNERIVVDYNNIHQDACDTKCLTPLDLPYFEGDFWPNALEDIFKSVEENRRKEMLRGDLEDLDDDLNEDGDSNHGSFDSDRKPGSAGSGSGGVGGSKKKTKKRKMKRTTSALSIAGGSSKRKRLAAAGSGDAEAEVQRRLDEALQRNAEAFLTINLYARNQVANLQPIDDPDPLFASEMMECRDTFLGRARERHLEFSTLRRAKFSTLTFLYDVHTENKDAFVYSCNACQKEIETPLQCKQCPNFHLCEACYRTRGHPHPMERLVVNDENVNTAAVQQSDRKKMEQCVRLLVHASGCRDANCRTPSCLQLRRRLEHFKEQHDRNKCNLCRPLHKIITAHSTKCNDSRCQVSFCAQFKALKKQQESQQRLRKVQTLRRRQKTMQRYNNSKPQQPNTPQPAPPNMPPVGAPPHPAPSQQQIIGSTASPSVSQCTPNSSEPPHSFSSQTSLTSPHSASNSRNSPAKPTSHLHQQQQPPSHPPQATQHPVAAAAAAAAASAGMQYSPYHLPMPSPVPPSALNKCPGSQQAQQTTPYHHMPSPADYQQQAPSVPVASPYAQHSVVYQQQQQQQAQMQTSQPPTPQMMAKGYSQSEAAFVRQNSNPLPQQQVIPASSAGFPFENGQANPLMRTANSRMPYAMPSESDEMAVQMQQQQQQQQVYGLPMGGMKRQYLSECDMMPTASMAGGAANIYAAGGKPMMQRSMSAVVMPPHNQQQQQQQMMMQWNAVNGQVMPPTTGSPKVVASRPTQQAPQHMVNNPPQITQADVQQIQEARHKLINDNEFGAWLQQHPHLVPAWNYLRQQQQPKHAMPHQYSSHPQLHQQMMRNSAMSPAGYIPNPQARMMQPGGVGGAMPSAWGVQQQQAVDPRNFRPSCYAPMTGKPAYGQPIPPTQPQQMMASNPYAAFQAQQRYSMAAAPPDPNGRSIGVRPSPSAMPPGTSQRLAGTPTAAMSPRPPAPQLPNNTTQQSPYVTSAVGAPPGQAQPSQLSQLLVQPQPAAQPRPPEYLPPQQH